MIIEKLNHFLSMVESALAIELSKCTATNTVAIVREAKNFILTKLKQDTVLCNRIQDNEIQTQLITNINESIRLKVKSDGKISIEGGVVNSIILSALEDIDLNHGDGNVKIEYADINAKNIYTGGTGSGSTFIGENSELRSYGTSIILGEGCSIVIEGNAQIEQS